MKMTDYLESYLNTRRAGWPYEGRYSVRGFGCHGFVAMIGDRVAGLTWADVRDGAAYMHLRLKPEYGEFGIGTELLHRLMEHLIEAGCHVIRYNIPVEYWAYQIYEHLGFEIEGRTADTISFVRYVGGEQ